MNILFVCSKNQWRSRTAETVFKERQDHNVRSAGTATDARVKVNPKLMEWADLIFVMEKRHKQILEEKFGRISMAKKLIVLDIGDNYQYMEEELIEILKITVEPYL